MQNSPEPSDTAADDADAVWEQRTRADYRTRGIGERVGFGACPALLIIDMQVGFTDPASPLGMDQSDTIEAIQELQRATRGARQPVIYTVSSFRRDLADAGLWTRKAPALANLTEDGPLVEIDPRLRPGGNDYIIHKKRSSAFLMTNLLAVLQAHKVDTVLVTGCTTSACVRASAVDGASYGFHVIVPEEAVADRADGPHRANLFDIDTKYGDVVPLQSALEYLEGLTHRADNQP